MADRWRQVVNPGPIDGSVLTLQNGHRSSRVWESNCEVPMLTCRRREARLRPPQGRDNGRLDQLLKLSGFYGIHRLNFIRLDWALITALAERWRQETHTFHLPTGEATITLQDVEVILGLPVNGYPVTGPGLVNWAHDCEELLGSIPPPKFIHSSRLEMSWLSVTFGNLQEHANDEAILRYARAYILELMGGIVFPDKSQTLVKLMYLPLLRDLTVTGQYSWGAAALSCLYRELCRATHLDAKDIAGPLILLQVWAWERLPIFRPERVRQTMDEEIADGPLGCRWMTEFSTASITAHTLVPYRDQLDYLHTDQFVWSPYSGELLASLPDYCVAGKDIWRAAVPLICFDVVEWHLPDRVLRQFGFHQPIPSPCDTSMTLHQVDRRGKSTIDWRVFHQAMISIWERRRELVVDGQPYNESMLDNDPYMTWYRSITRRLIGPVSNGRHLGFQPTAAVCDLLMRGLTNVYQASQRGADSSEVRSICLATMDVVDQTYRLYIPEEPTLPIPPEARKLKPVKASRKRKKKQTSTMDQETINQIDEPTQHYDGDSTCELYLEITQPDTNEAASNTQNDQSSSESGSF